MKFVRGCIKNGVFVPYGDIALPSGAEATLLFWEGCKPGDEKAFWAEFDRLAGGEDVPTVGDEDDVFLDIGLDDEDYRDELVPLG